MITNKTINDYMAQIIDLREKIAILEKELKPLESAAKKALESRCLESYTFKNHGYKLVSRSVKKYDHEMISEIIPAAISLNTITGYRYF